MICESSRIMAADWLEADIILPLAVSGGTDFYGEIGQ